MCWVMGRAQAAQRIRGVWGAGPLAFSGKPKKRKEHKRIFIFIRNNQIRAPRAPRRSLKCIEILQNQANISTTLHLSEICLRGRPEANIAKMRLIRLIGAQRYHSVFQEAHKLSTPRLLICQRIKRRPKQVEYSNSRRVKEFCHTKSHLTSFPASLKNYHECTLPKPTVFLLIKFYQWWWWWLVLL